MRRGQTLHNGAIVIDVVEPTDDVGGVVLAMRVDAGHYDDFIVWHLNPKYGEPESSWAKSTHSGAYFETIAAAAREYDRRKERFELYQARRAEIAARRGH